MRLLSRMSLPFALLALALAGPAAGFASAHGRSDVVGHVYVNDNTTGMNTIAGFDRHADGSLAPERDPRSPPVAPAPARASPLKARFRSPQGRYLVAVDAGSTSSRCGESSATAHSGSFVTVSFPPMVCCRSASRSTIASCMSPTPARSAPTTPASSSATTAACTRSPLRPSRCQMGLSRATCCSTAREANSSQHALDRLTSTASPSGQTDV